MATVSDAIIVEIGADVSEMRKGMKDLEKRVTGSSKKMSTGVKSLGKSVLGLGAAFGGLMAVKRIASTFFDINRESEKLMASLRTVTGSAKSARSAFRGIEQIAQSTPFQIEELTQGFIKMKALGLQPTEEAILSFGNTASAMGKSFNQMIEAIADASTFEFERLKEFGIKAKQQQDTVSFTFQGITTTVKKNAKDITAFLQSIGEVNFAGAMEEQMGTIDGILSNTADNFGTLARTIGGEGGVNTEVKNLLSTFRDFTGEIVSQPKFIAAWANFTIRAVKMVGSVFVTMGTAVKNLGDIFADIATSPFKIGKLIGDGMNPLKALDAVFGSLLIKTEGNLNDIKKAFDGVIDNADDLVFSVHEIGTAMKEGPKKAAKETTDEFNKVAAAGVGANNVMSDWQQLVISMKDPLSELGHQAARLAGELVKGDISLKEMLKTLTTTAFKEGIARAADAFLPGSGGLVRSFLSIFKHGGIVGRPPRKAQFGLSVPSSPAGNMGVPIVAHPGERVFTRREVKSMFGEMSPASRVPDRSGGGMHVENVYIGGSEIGASPEGRELRGLVSTIMSDERRKGRF